MLKRKSVANLDIDDSTFDSLEKKIGKDATDNYRAFYTAFGSAEIDVAQLKDLYKRLLGVDYDIAHPVGSDVLR